MRFPRGVNPVQLSDVFFACHGIFATTVIITQCFIYEVSHFDAIFWSIYSRKFFALFQRAGQSVSLVARFFLSMFTFCFVLAMILSIAKIVDWLDLLYICSYIKLSITLIKYTPQVRALTRIAYVCIELSKNSILFHFFL